MIRRVKGGFQLISKEGKNLGKFPTRKQAMRRERQVKWFAKRKKK